MTIFGKWHDFSSWEQIELLEIMEAVSFWKDISPFCVAADTNLLDFGLESKLFDPHTSRLGTWGRMCSSSACGIRIFPIL